MARVQLTARTSVFDQLEHLHQRIAERAYSLFQGRNGSSVDALVDWLTAEREVIWKPAIEVREQDGTFNILAALPGVDAKDIEVDVTPEDVVVKAKMREHEDSKQKGTVHSCELVSGEAFRSVSLPKPIDVGKAKADFHNGMLRITAPVAAEAPPRRVEVTAA